MSVMSDEYNDEGTSTLSDEGMQTRGKCVEEQLVVGAVGKLVHWLAAGDFSFCTALEASNPSGQLSLSGSSWN